MLSLSKHGRLTFVTLALGAMVGALLAATSAATPAPLRELHWLAPSVDAVRAATSRPTECLGPSGEAEAHLVELGRAAFRSPLLLGGQAARAGLACESCHRSGRGNPEFLFPGLSGAPGTADVTAALFSSHRGDGVDNPKPIPDLTGPPESLKISRDANRPDLRNFIRGLVVEEFDGAEPPPAILDGLAAYVRRLSPQSCPSASVERYGVREAMAEARRAVRAAAAAVAHSDTASAAVMVLAARSQLGRIDERYRATSQGQDMAILRSADLDLATALEMIRARQLGAGERLSLWLAQSAGLAARLERDEAQSLFNPEILAASIGR